MNSPRAGMSAGRAANYVTDAQGILQTAPLVGNSVYTKNNAKKLVRAARRPRLGLFGNGKTAVRASFGTYYSLIDDLSFLLNSLPPYNGAASFSNVSLHRDLPSLRACRRRPPADRASPRPAPLFAPQGVQADAKTPAVQEWNFRIEQQLTETWPSASRTSGHSAIMGWSASIRTRFRPQICGRRRMPRGRHGRRASTVPQGTLTTGKHSGVSRRPADPTPTSPQASSGTRKATAAITRCRWM